jgi:hypothetical protein
MRRSIQRFMLKIASEISMVGLYLSFNYMSEFNSELEHVGTFY